MKLSIVKYGDKVLREHSKPVGRITAELVRLVEDMIDTMHAARGVGLAAQQVGRTEALCVIDIPEGCEDDEEIEAFNAQVAMPLVMFNPVVVAVEGSQEGKEGCLSFPGVGGRVTRPAVATVQFTNLEGQPCIVTGKGFLARAIMHETDHLNGVLYIDQMTAPDKLALAGKLDKLVAKNGGNR